MTLAPDSMQFLISIIKKRTGIALNEQKLYLLESRLLPVAQMREFQSIADMASMLRLTQDEAMIRDIIEAITTNESSFFRDVKPFEQLRNTVIPHLIHSMPHKKHFRIWSAACSHGQEPYSIAMSLLEDIRYRDFTFEIIATDISNDALEKARQALYTQFEVQRGVPISLLVKYFDKEGDDAWRLKEKVRNMVQFRHCNLIDEFHEMGVFDIIFCRNVLIYFDPETKAEVLHKLSNQLEPHGLIFLGGTESISAQIGSFIPFGEYSSIHRKA